MSVIDKILNEILKVYPNMKKINEELKMLKNFDVWKDFESQNYEICDIDGKKGFVINDIKMTFDEFWNDGIGKLKKEIIQKQVNNIFLKKNGNFSGITLNDMKICAKTFDRNYNMVFKNARFIRCKFDNMYIIDNTSRYPMYIIEEKSNEICNVLFHGNVFKNCEFDNVTFCENTIEGCSFYNCKELKNVNIHDFSLSGKSVYKSIKFTHCMLEKCKFFGIYRGICFNDSELKNVDFELSEFSDLTLKDNVFEKCKFDYIELLQDIEFWKNDFKECSFVKANLKNIIFLGINNFNGNKYNIYTKISKRYINNFLLKHPTKFFNRESELYEIYASIHNNIYIDLKNTSMKDIAYEHYYLYRKINMLKVCSENSLFLHSILRYFLFDNEIFGNIIAILILLICLYEYPIALANAAVLLLIFELIISRKSVFEFISYALCGFGEKPQRTLFYILGIVTLSAFLFMYTGIGGDELILYKSFFSNSYIQDNNLITTSVNTYQWIKDFSHSLYFSIVTFTTIGYGDMKPITDWSKIIVVCEAASSVFLISLFTATFIRKVIRE